MAGGVLLALGGNALLPRGSAGTIDEQISVTTHSVRALAGRIGERDRVVITHGNGPVVGNIVLRNEAASDQVPPMPLDVCGADSQGGMGYMIVQCVERVLAEVGVSRPVTALVSRVEVAADDPALTLPTKPIGPFYSRERAAVLRAEKGWAMREDSGRGWRRVVGSPRPLGFLELGAIVSLLQAGHVVVAAGGGGIPVAADGLGGHRGVEAVIDKDRASSLLATVLGIEHLIIVTDVEHVALNWGTPEQRDLDRLTMAEAERYLEEGQFGVGSMYPKIEAAVSFLRSGGKQVHITSPERLAAALEGNGGTVLEM